MNIAASVERGCRDYPSRPALIADERRTSYRHLDEQASRMAGWLRRRGIERGDRVALCLPNTPDFVAGYLAILKLGAIVVSVDTGLTGAERAFVLSDSGAKEVFAADSLPSLEELSREADHLDSLDLPSGTPAAILYTSGTTGTPRGATLSHTNVIFNSEMSARYCGIRPEDRLLLFLPLHHCFGQNAILNAGLHAGATSVLHLGFDSARILSSIAEDSITMVFGVPTTFIVLAEQASVAQMRGVRYYFSAAATLPPEIEARWRAKFDTPIHQGYGLTETSPFASYNHCTAHRPGTIGTPIDGVDMRVVDVTDGREVAEGEVGEIVIRGPNVMLGYWNRPADTAATIRAGWLHSGDIGRKRADGYFVIEDRLKDMVIVGGANVYPAEVENVLYQHEAVDEAAVHGIADPVMGERVRAVIVLKSGAMATEPDIIRWCRERLAAYKVPAEVTFAETLPKNRTGKVLKRVLRDSYVGKSHVGRVSPKASPAGSDAGSQDRAYLLRREITDWLAATLDMNAADLDPARPFSDYGLTSIQAVDLAAAIERLSGQQVAPTIAWSLPTLDALLRHLSESDSKATEAPIGGDEPIAIIGMGCRYPGSPNLDAFWTLLRDGVDAITEVPSARWDRAAFFDADSTAPGKMTTRWGGYIDHIEELDAAFFGISPREAPHVDPRQRVMLEVVWEALEQAGISADALAGSRTGVFVASLADDFSHLLFENLRRIEAYSGAGTANSILANRVSYFLDLRGPSVVVDTACSGSLVAVHLACESLRRGESELAIAGGVSIDLAPKNNIFFSKAGALAADGRCKTFDARADGMVRSDGAGVLILKRLSKAIEDGDPIAAIVRGTAINHDGRSNGIMAPNGEAQQQVLVEAYRHAGVSPAQVQYVEAHGTGTRLGDPIEVQALGAVLARGRGPAQVCALGSVKTNIGHTEAAAGVAGIIKTALAMQHRVLPRSLHFDTPNPLIPFGKLPFAVQRTTGPWPSEAEPLIAGVSGFGFGGTNAHVVLEEAPRRAAAALAADSPTPPPYLLALSARTPGALRSLAAAYLALLNDESSRPEIDVGDLCYTAAVHRTHHAHLLAIVGDSRQALGIKLGKRISEVDAPGAAAAAATSMAARDGAVAFVFSGQGSHWPLMGRELSARQPVFKAAMEECERLIALAGSSAADEPLAIFCVQVALAALWRSWGIVPDVICGHSLGEVAAAHVAGALSLRDAVTVAVHRSRLMKTLAGLGKTAVVGVPFEEALQLAQRHGSALAAAGANSPTTSVLSGDPEVLSQALRELESAGKFCRLLAGVDVAFHSPQMDPLKAELLASLSRIAPKRSTIPIVSSVTGAEVEGESFDAAYWWRNLREPFRFDRATARLLARGCRVLVEVAPHAALTSSMLQTLRHVREEGASAPAVVTSMRRDESAMGTMLAALAVLYEAGSRVVWKAVCQGEGQLVSTPSYPWDRKRFWFDQMGAGAPKTEPTAPTATKRAALHPLLGERVQTAFVAGEDQGGRHVSLWEIDLSADQPGYLADHRVFGDVVVPGAVFVEMAVAAARQTFVESAISGVRFEHALRLTPDEIRRVQILFRTRDAEAEFFIYSRSVSAGNRHQPWTRHVSGHVEAVEGDTRLALAAKTLGVMNPPPPQYLPFPAAQHFEEMRALGLEYGPAFRAATEFWRGEGEAICALDLPKGVAAIGYACHPAILDGGFQAVAAALGYTHSYLPAAVGTWTFNRRLTGALLCHARVAGKSGDKRCVADLDFVDGSGRVCAELRGLELRRVTLPARAQKPDTGVALEDSVIEERWEPQPLEYLDIGSESRAWMVLADDGGVGRAVASLLKQTGQRVVVSRSYDFSAPSSPADRYHAIVDFRALDAISADQSVGSALRLIHAMASAQLTARLWLVTRGAKPAHPSNPTRLTHLRHFTHLINPEQAALHGLALVAGEEHPEFKCTTLDLDPAKPGTEARELFDELMQSGAETSVAWRDGARVVSRVAAAPLVTNLDEPARLSADGTYLITGGLGALGLQTARLLARSGAGHLVLVGRGSASSHKHRPEIDAIELLGARVHVVAADIASHDDVALLFTGALSQLPPLRGVIHAAGVIDDGPVDRQSMERFRRVMAPKLAGTWNLHLRTRDLPLDFFVCFSSVASLIGSPGQSSYAAANAYMDAVMHYRRQLGFPGLSINWGAWADAGMAATEQARRRLAMRGVLAIDPDEALRLLSHFLRPDETSAQFGVMPADWNKLLSQFPGGAPPRLALGTAPASPAAGVSIQQSPPAISELRHYLREELTAVLGFAADTEVSPHQPFFDFGMDSLMSMELSNRLQARLGIALPSTVAFDYPTLQALGDHVEQCLFAESGV